MAQERGREQESQKMTGTSGKSGGNRERAAHEPEEVLDDLQKEQRGGNRSETGNQGGGERREWNRTDLKTAGIRVGGPSGRGPAPTSGESARTPGATGRPMNRRQQHEEIEPEVAEREAAGAQSGGTRKVAVTNKKNKRRAA